MTRGNTTKKKATAVSTRTRTSKAAKTTPTRKRTPTSPAKSSAVFTPKAAGDSAPADTSIVVPARTLRKKELVDAIVLRSGIKKKDAKPVVEAMLAELGEALAQGRDLALPPLGRVLINREKERPDGRIIIAKIRQKDKTERLADAVASLETEKS